MEPSHLSPTERNSLQRLADHFTEQGDPENYRVVTGIIIAHAAPNPCNTSRLAFGQTLQCAGVAGHDGPHTAIDKAANVHAVWTDEQG